MKRFTVAYSTADEAMEAYHADDIYETISKCNDDRYQAIYGLRDALNEKERAYYQSLLITIYAVQDELISWAKEGLNLPNARFNMATRQCI